MQRLPIKQPTFCPDRWHTICVLLSRVATFAKMAAGGSSSKWLKISRHDTEDVPRSAVEQRKHSAGHVWFFLCLRVRLVLRADRQLRPRQEANMKRYFIAWISLPFWASPNSSIYDLILQSNGWSGERRARALDPGFPSEDPIKEPPIRPVRPIPTDVPVPDPHDVPVRDPMDVPPPEPGVKPKPVKPIPPPRPTP